MNYTLHQLRVFQQVAKTSSITRAADHLFMTPPAVAKQIKNLAELLNVVLFETVGKKLLLTHEGQQLSLSIDKLLTHAKSFEHEVLQLKDLPEARIKLSITNTFQVLFFPFLATYRNLNPGIEFEMSLVPWKEQQKHYQNDSFDFYFCGDVNLEKNDYAIDVFDHFQFILVAHPDNDISGKKITTDLLSREQFITGSAESESQQDQEKYFKKWKLVHQPIRVDSYGSVAEAVKAGLGIALLPNNIAVPMMSKNEIIKLDYPLKSTTYPMMLARHKNKSLTEPMRHFRDYFLHHWSLC